MEESNWGRGGVIILVGYWNHSRRRNKKKRVTLT
jgi:hypothetical protein